MNNGVKTIIGGGVLTVILGIIGTTTNAIPIITGWGKSIEEKSIRNTRVESQIDVMSKEIERLRNDNNQARKNAKSIDDLAKTLRKIEAQSSVGNDSKAILQVAILQKRFDDLEEKISNLPASTQGGISEAALNAAINRAIQQTENRLQSKLEASITPIVENKIAAIPASSGDGVPIATKRRIHFVEKDCVYLPSFGRKFTLKFKKNTEFCIEPSQLYATVYRIDSDREIHWDVTGGTNYRCRKNRYCFFGEEDWGFRYRIKNENQYEKQGITYAEWHFEKVE